MTDFRALVHALRDAQVDRRTPGNMARIVRALAPHGLGDITGGGGYEQLLPHTDTVTVFGVECRCPSLDRLIHVKRAAGRVQDLEAIAELEAIRQERDRDDRPSD